MKIPVTRSLPVLAFACLSLAGVSAGFQAAPQNAPDNTKTNKRDRSPSEPTADQQKMNSGDRQTTRDIRRAIVGDKSLSTYAHNIKIISQNGMVTLKGPVHTEDEKKAIEAKAVAVVGSADKVKNEISVKP